MPIAPACRSKRTSSTTRATTKITASNTVFKQVLYITIALFFLTCCDHHHHHHHHQPSPTSSYFVKGINPVYTATVPLVSILQQRKRMSPNDNKKSASALGELKETIRSQAKEIERLKAKIGSGSSGSGSGSSGSDRKKKVTSSGGGGGGHGGDCELTEEELAKYLNDPFYMVASQRVGWLGIFLASLSATALIMNVFEETLEKHIELALFVPLLAGHGGNTGGQTVGTILSALSAGTVKVSDAPRVIWKEAFAGLMSGSILGAFVAPIAYKMMGVSFHVAAVLFFTLPLLSMTASTLGAIIPFICVLVRLDPSVIAAPAMTSLVDVAGLMGYFMIANYVFKFYGLEL